MLQSSFFDPVLGVDIHIVMVPMPAPVPTPVPMPFVGMVFDPVGLAVGAAIGMATGGGPGLVMVNSLPVTNAGTNVTNMMTMPHLPVPGVAFAKGLPGNDAELFFGSLNVTLAGSLGVRLGEIAMSCSDPVRLPTSVVLAIPKGMPVLTIRPPVPDVQGIAMRFAMLGAMKLLKAAARGGARLFRALRAAQRNSGKWARVSGFVRGIVDRIAPERFRDRLKRAVCFVTGHPVDVATGRVFTDNIDFELPGPLPLVFERVYSSSLSWRNGPLGYGWSHSLDQQVWLEPNKVVLLAEDGREIEFHLDGFPDGTIRAGQSVYDPTNRLTLRAMGDFRWEVESAQGLVREFAPVPGGEPHRARLLRIRSRDGHHSIQLTYDARGRLEWGRDCGGRMIAFVHDKEGRLAEVKLPLSRESGFYRHLKYVYSPSGDLVEVVDAAGHSWKFDYQGHLLVQETDRTGLSFYFQYDGLGASARCVRTWGDGGIYDHVISYDVQNRKTVVEDSLGAVTVYQMDDLGMVVKVVDPHGAVTEYAYDENCGELAKEVDALGHERLTTYDRQGNVVEVREPNGATVRFEYDARGLPMRATDALGGTWTWAYDREGHLTEKVTPAGERTVSGWKKGLLVSTDASSARPTLLEYDTQKNLIRSQAPHGALTEYEYDGHGRVMRVRDARSAITRFRYDVLGNLLQVESPTGVVQERAYDAQGNLLEVRDGLRHVRFRYGHFHKTVAKEESGTVLRFAYDTEGRLTDITNEAGEAFHFTLDDCGRVRAEIGFDGRTRAYERDMLGQVTRIHLPSSRFSEFTYDAAGRPLSVQHSDGTGTEFTYRADGALVRARNESATLRLERDAVGRVVRESLGDFVVSSRFDNRGKRALLETSLGGRMAVLRDASGTVSSLYCGGEDLPGLQRTVHFDRDALGLESARLAPGGLRVEWRRDGAGRPTGRRTVRQLAGGESQSLSARTYEWRGEDQIAAMGEDPRGLTRYQHDARGRLVAQVDNQGTLHHAMDAVGNVFRTPALTDSRYEKGGRLEEALGARYFHDEDGNLTEKVEADGRRWRYRWNGAGLLSEVQRPDGRKVRFDYDAFARRTRKLLVRTGPDGGEVIESEIRFVWDGDVVVHELTKDLGSITWYWEPGTFTPILRESQGHCWPLASDHLGTPTEMYTESGEIAWRMQLDSFGVAKTEAVLGNCSWRWPGQYEDEETGLYYNRFRYYDPATCRYISQDPLGLAGGLNAYEYAPDPFVWTDPLGLERGLWRLTDAMSDAKKVMGGRTYYRHVTTGLWWSVDTAGHGGSAFKVFTEGSGGTLNWFRDADQYGDFIDPARKHKGRTGKKMCG
jgi:RHS repeat-associated protein